MFPCHYSIYISAHVCPPQYLHPPCWPARSWYVEIAPEAMRENDKKNGRMCRSCTIREPACSKWSADNVLPGRLSAWLHILSISSCYFSPHLESRILNYRAFHDICEHNCSGEAGAMHRSAHIVSISTFLKFNAVALGRRGRAGRKETDTGLHEADRL